MTSKNIHEKHTEIITIRDPPAPQKVRFYYTKTHVFINPLRSQSAPQNASKWTLKETLNRKKTLRGP